MTSISPSESPRHDDDYVSAWKNLKSREDLAALLGASDRGLRELLYGGPRSRLYRTFTIPKKSGETRTIASPVPRLKSIQRRLLRVLTKVYSPRPQVHGFARKRSICTNAKNHIRRHFVLNVDLVDFFPTINFGRVRGLFMAGPYYCTEQVATVLAQICCHNNELPQGAPTSPIVANMICAKLDSHLNKLSEKYKCRYSRYADDLTISCGRRTFPPQLAKVQFIDGRESVSLGSALVGTIESNGFKVNQSKVRLQRHNQRQVVTGLVTNSKVNVRRTYIRNIRALLRHWELNGPQECQRVFVEKYGEFYGGRGPRVFKEFVAGQIDFVGSVRGRNDPIYLKLLHRLYSLDKAALSRQAKQLVIEYQSFEDHTLDKLWVIESINDDGLPVQSTGFSIANRGIVTCAHGVNPNAETVLYRRWGGDCIQATVSKIDEGLDLATLSTDGLELTDVPFTFDEPKIGDAIIIAGFPHFGPGSTGVVDKGYVTGKGRDADGNPMVMISADVLFGNSGGPVFNQHWEVVGVVARGNSHAGVSPDRHFNQFIPIASLFRLL